MLDVMSRKGMVILLLLCLLVFLIIGLFFIKQKSYTEKSFLIPPQNEILIPTEITNSYNSILLSRDNQITLGSEIFELLKTSELDSHKHTIIIDTNSDDIFFKTMNGETIMSGYSVKIVGNDIAIHMYINPNQEISKKSFISLINKLYIYGLLDANTMRTSNSPNYTNSRIKANDISVQANKKNHWFINEVK